MKNFLLAVILLFPFPALADDAPAAPCAATDPTCAINVQQTEADLAAANKEFILALPKHAQRGAYDRQVAWFKFRNSVCDLEGSEQESEDDVATAIVRCTARMNKERTAQLDEMRKQLKK